MCRNWQSSRFNIFHVLALVLPAVAPLPPTIIVPGIMAAVLEAKWDTASGCGPSSGGWYDIWVSRVQMTRLSCFVKTMALEHNKTNGCVENPEGVSIRALGFGNTSGIDVLNPSDTLGRIVYFQVLTQALRDVGFSDGETLFAAPYDWRKYGDRCFNRVFFTKLRDLIESAVKLNRGRRARILCHSMGCVVVHIFLTTFVNWIWKMRYVKELIALAAPFAGAPYAVKQYMDGVPYKWIPTRLRSSVAPVMRSFPSLVALFPVQMGRDPVWRNRPFVSTPSFNFTGEQGVHDLLHRLERPNESSTLTWWSILRGRSRKSTPGVRTHCIYMTDVPTLVGTKYHDDEFQNVAAVLMGHGDGTVPTVSSKVPCEWWAKRQKPWAPVTCQAMSLGPKVTHKSMLQDPEVIGAIIARLLPRSDPEYV